MLQPLVVFVTVWFSVSCTLRTGKMCLSLWQKQRTTSINESYYSVWTGFYLSIYTHTHISCDFLTLPNSHLLTTKYIKSCKSMPQVPHCSVLLFLHATGLGKSGWKAAWKKRTLRCWSIAGWTWASSVPRWPRRPTASWLVSGTVWPAGAGRWLCPSTQRWWGQTSSTVFSFGPLTIRKTWSCWSVSTEEQQGWWRAWRTSLMGSGWRNWGCLV